MESVVLNNRYRLLELIGSGGMAVVYRGVDMLLQRQVAVKVLRETFSGDPAFLARFQREAQAAASLDHPNIVTVYDVGYDGSRHYIVMEYVDGSDLKTMIRQRGYLSVEETLNIIIQVAAGVGHAHKMNVIHCDVKPQNVLVTRDGRAVVTDFGIARALSESGLTESETVWGSPHYFSPEQAAGDPPTPASDVYSIGVVMYEMLAGFPPFQAEKPAALALMHMREEPAPLAARNPQVPPQLEWIVRKVMAKEPAARYRNAEQLAHVLEEYCKHGGQATGWQPAAPAPAPAPSSPPLARPPAGAPLASAGAPAGAGAVAPVSDGLTWILGAVDLVLVLGLLVLWGGFVIPAYSTPPSVGRPTPSTPKPLITLTPTVQQVVVPNVLQQPMDEARRTVERAGLVLEIRGERDEPGLEGGVVLEQQPTPGDQLPRGSKVSVIVSKLGVEIQMPDVVDYDVEEMQTGLESNGLNVVRQDVWSTEPIGLVLAQEPVPGTVLHAGGTVTLTVSGGVDIPIPLQVKLADLVVLEGAELRQKTFRPGSVVPVTLRWQVLKSTVTNYRVFVHLQDLDGPYSTPVAQGDAEPIVRTPDWSAGMFVVDPHQVRVPDGLSAGLYQLRVGLYSPASGARVPVTDPGLSEVELDSILVTLIEVQP